MNPKTIRAYLDKHAEPLAAPLPEPGKAEFVVVVPMRGEGRIIEGLIESIDSAQSRGPILMIAVVNGAKDGKQEHHRANEETLHFLMERFGITMTGDSPYGLGRKGNLELLLVDHASAAFRLEARQGVGLARKIGCDLALLFQDKGRINSPWIHSSDADVQLPPDYFEGSIPLDADESVAALTYPFLHKAQGEPAQRQAIRLYEISLYYYVLGLQWAGSPYAYQTIGSTIAFRAWNYAAVRGFPKKEAGEDFYLLNKMAKTGKIQTPQTTPITILGRFSDRVPFGTGAALNDMGKDPRLLGDFPFYSPQLFMALKLVLDAMNAFAESGLYEDFQTRISGADGTLGAGLLEIISQMNFRKALEEASRQATTGDALRRRLATWFDSFKTLRFLHRLRDECCPSIPWHIALSTAPFIPLAQNQLNHGTAIFDKLRREISEIPCQLRAGV